MGDQAGRKNPPPDIGYDRPLVFERFRRAGRYFAVSLAIIFAMYMTYWIFL